MTQGVLWHADHVFLPPGRMSDLFLIQVVKPFLLGLEAVREWFFIRYGEGGSHLRIRIKASDPVTSAVVHQHWRRCVPAFLDGVALGAEWRVSIGPNVAPGTIITVPYEPEISRYGGIRAMPIGERIFCRSSALALGIIEATPNNPDARIGQTISMMLTSASVLTRDQKAIGRLFRAYAEGWRTYLAAAGWVPSAIPVSVVDADAIIRALQPDGRPTFGSAWRASLLEMLDALDAVGPLTASRQDIVMSQLHMLCNRLGVSPPMEFYLANQIGGVL